eukprot:618805-Amphidinium_carterae.1
MYSTTAYGKPKQCGVHSSQVSRGGVIATSCFVHVAPLLAPNHEDLQPTLVVLGPVPFTISGRYYVYSAAQADSNNPHGSLVLLPCKWSMCIIRQRRQLEVAEGEGVLAQDNYGVGCNLEGGPFASSICFEPMLSSHIHRDVS